MILRVPQVPRVPKDPFPFQGATGHYTVLALLNVQTPTHNLQDEPRGFKQKSTVSKYTLPCHGLSAFFAKDELL